VFAQQFKELYRDNVPFLEECMHRNQCKAVERSNCESTSDTFLPTTSSTVPATSLPEQDGEVRVAITRYRFKAGKSLRSLLDEVQESRTHIDEVWQWPAQERDLPEEWTELDGEELDKMKLDDNTILAVVRHDTTQLDAHDDQAITSYTIVHACPEPDIHNFTKAELTGKLLQMITGQQVHQNAKYTLEDTPEEVKNSLKRYLVSQGAAIQRGN
jgi:hypothetical protein